MSATQPAVRYARSGDVHVAYQVVGDGALDIVFVDGFVTNRHVLWEEPAYRRFCERLGSFARVILFDKRGMGLSDRVQAGTLEERMDDVRAGVHTGECEVLGDKLAGLAAHVRARVAAQAGTREVLVSSTVRDLIAGSGIELEDRGLFTLNGLDGERRLLAVA